MSRRIRLVVVDDHSLFRRGLVSLLSEMPDFEVVGEAGNGTETLPLIARVDPDLILLDINMPGMDGIQTVEALRKAHSRARIMMLTVSQQDSDLIGAIVAGADGYLLKNTEPEDLRTSLLRMAQGDSVLSPEVTKTVMHALTRQQVGAANNPLSDRELEVLDCLSGGQTTLQIATRLFISENTVKTHIRHILEKLDAVNRTEAVSKAMQMGIIQKTE